MENLFQKYVNSVLNPDEFSRLPAFLSDEAHAESIDRVSKEIWQKQPDNEEEWPESNQLLFQKIVTSIQINETLKAEKKIRVISWGLKIAAVLIVGLVTGSLLYIQKLNDIKAENFLQTMTIPTGARSSLYLPDGTKVWLNSGSTLIFPSRFDKTRSVTLSGEAFFEVVRAKYPFVISTSMGEVKVKGTSFNVNAFDGAGILETTLVSGMVSIRDKNSGTETMLKPGEQATVTGGIIKVQKVETELFTSWKEGKLIFRKEYLPEVVKRLERWYNVTIQLDDDPRLQKIWYTGTLEMESFSEVLDLLKITAPINYSFNDKTRIIKINYRKR